MVCRTTLRIVGGAVLRRVGRCARLDRDYSGRASGRRARRGSAQGCHLSPFRLINDVYLVCAVQIRYRTVDHTRRFRTFSHLLRNPELSTLSREGRIARLARILDVAFMFASVVASLGILVWVLSLCRHGFDFTDDGFYLAWITFPEEYRSSISQFGFVYHPLFKILAEDIVLLRQVNVLLIFAIAFLLVIAALNSLSARQSESGPSLSAWRFLNPALVAASSALAFFDLWLPTPNYNSLAFVSLLVTAIGAMLSGRDLSRWSVGGWVIIGVGGALTFLAKPTSAAVLACLVFIYVVAVRKFSIGGLLVASLSAFLIMMGMALLVDGSPHVFLERYRSGIELAKLLTSGQPAEHLFRWDEYTLSEEQNGNFVRLLVLTFAMVVFSASTSVVLRVLSTAVAMVVVVFTFCIGLGWVKPTISYEPFQPLMFAVILIAVLVAGLLFSRCRRGLLSRDVLVTAFFFALLPYAYAFGTSNNYWQQGARAGFFWLLAGVVLRIAPAVKETAITSRFLTPVLAAGVLATTGILFAATEHPYRQTAPLRAQVTATEFGVQGRQVMLTADAAAYVSKLRTIATNNGFVPGRPIVDLSGVSPGTVYALGGKAPGTAWLLAGYPGSGSFLKASLAKVGCEELAVSWILSEPGSPDTFSFEVLRPYGIDVMRDYADVGAVQSVRAFAPARFEQRIYKPLRSAEEATEACRKARQNS